MLKKASNKVEVLDLDGTKIYAVRADKSVYDDYADELFDRTATGELKVKSGRAILEVYRRCVKKVENCIVDGKEVAELSDPAQIVDFLAHLEDPMIGKQIDNWLLNISMLNGEEQKN